jgi:hypothetical protein
MDLREVGGGGIDWIDLAEDREQRGSFVIMVINLWAP